MIDFTPEMLQQIAAGASGGIPMSLMLLASFRSLKHSMDQLKERLEQFSTRLQRVEVTFDVHFQSELKRLSEGMQRLETRLQVLESTPRGSDK